MNRIARSITVASMALIAPVVHAQEIKLTIPSETRYTIEPAPKFKPIRQEDGTIRIRVQVTQHVLLKPDGYAVANKTTLLDDVLAPESIDPIAKSDFEKLRIQAFDENEGIRSDKKVFALGDFVRNDQETKRLVTNGVRTITAADEIDALKAAEPYLKLLNDPKRIDDSQAKFENHLAPINFRRSGRWTIDKYTIKDYDLPMYEVRIRWAMEAILDPKNPQAFPVLKDKPSIINSEQESSAVGAASGPEPQKESQKKDGGFDFTAILGLPAASALSSPGVDPVVGWSATDNSQGLIAGLNLRLNHPGKRLSDFTSSDRFGIFLGASQKTGNNPAFTVLAPSYMVGPNAIAFMGFKVGGGFQSNTQGKTRQSLAFGVAVKFNVSGVTEQHNDVDSQKSKGITLSVSQNNPTKAPSEETQTCVYFTKDSIRVDARTVDQGAVFTRGDKALGRTWGYWLSDSDFKEIKKFLSEQPKGNLTITRYGSDGPKTIEIDKFEFEPSRIYRITLIPPPPPPVIKPSETPKTNQ